MLMVNLVNGAASCEGKEPPRCHSWTAGRADGGRPRHSDLPRFRRNIQVICRHGRRFVEKEETSEKPGKTAGKAWIQGPERGNCVDLTRQPDVALPIDATPDFRRFTMTSRKKKKQAADVPAHAENDKPATKKQAARGKKADAAPVPATMAAEPVETTPPAKKPRADKQRQQSGKLSALDAAAKVLGETGQPMTCKEMIETMGAKGYWTSPGGRTPEATLYSAILRELKTKGADTRFRKTDRGKFASA